MSSVQPVDWTFKIKRGTTAEWQASTVPLGDGELGAEIGPTGTVGLKMGNGTSHWSSLPYIASGLGGSSSSGLQPSNNLSDLSNVSTARTNLGLGNSATRNVGTTSGTVAAGDDPRFSASSGLQPSNNLSDLADAATARTNLGLGNSATRAVGTTSGTVAAGDDSRMTNQRTPTDGSVTSAKLASGLAVATYMRGTISARPAASSVRNPTLYYATDSNGGAFFESNGSTWTQIGPSVNDTGRVLLGRSIDTAGIALGNITGSAGLGGYTYTALTKTVTIGSKIPTIEVDIPFIRNTAAASYISCNLYRAGSTLIQSAIGAFVGIGEYTRIWLKCIDDTVTAGTHTYTVAIVIGSGTQNVEVICNSSLTSSLEVWA